MRTELGLWSVLVGTAGVTGTGKVRSVQTCLKRALTCGMPLQLPGFGTYPALARSVTGRLAGGGPSTALAADRTSAGITVSRLAARIIGLRRRRERWCNPAVRITSDAVAGGICEQLFTVGEIPGVLWTPAEGSGPRPLVLIGHGGGQHKKERRAVPGLSLCHLLRFRGRLGRRAGNRRPAGAPGDQAARRRDDRAGGGG